MKKTLLITAFVLCAQVIFAQNQEEKKEKKHIQKGDWVVGGLFSINKSNQKTNYVEDNIIRRDTTFSYRIAPQIGYSFSDNWISGLSIGYGHTKNHSSRFGSDENDWESRSKWNSYSINPYITRFFGLSKNLFLNLKGSIRYTFSESSYYNSNADYQYRDSERNDLFIGFIPGITYFISDKFSLESTVGSFGYTKSKNDEEDSYSTEYNGFNADFNLSSIYFGISYYF